jgi:hypothetical protein
MNRNGSRNYMAKKISEANYSKLVEEERIPIKNKLHLIVKNNKNTLLIKSKR